MLALETLPASLAGLLWAFRSCFGRPTFATFTALTAGMIAAPARRSVCGMLTAAGLAGVWHHSRAHWFFSHARWQVDQLGLTLLRLIVAGLLPPDAPVVIAVDDTLFRRCGRKVAAAGWHYDGAAKTGGPRASRRGFGNCWVIAGIVVALPFRTRPMCLPVAFGLVCPDGPSKQVIACRLVAAIAAAVPDRPVHVVADAWYAGADGAPGAAGGATKGRGLPAGVSLTSRPRATATFRAIATPTPGATGRPRRRGPVLGTATDLAAAACFTPAEVCRYGRRDSVRLAQAIVLWYGVYRCRPVRVVLVREPGTTTGVDLGLVTTDLLSPPAVIVARYAARWAIEAAIEDGKQLTGVGQARNRHPRAVQRTVPFGLLVQSLVVLWYARHGHDPADLGQRRRAAPWYATKTEPTYQDMIVKLRRVLIAARFRAGKPRQPTDEEILAVQAAWADAAA
jgi:DDE superfamily endonuclease